MITRRGALMAAMLAIGASATAEAQLVGIDKSKVQVSCGPPASVFVKVVDADGKRVRDARIEVLRQRDKKKVAVPMNDLSLEGDYRVIDDQFVALVRPKGEPFVIRIRRGKTLTTKVLRFGRTTDGCHVLLLGPPAPIVLRR